MAVKSWKIPEDIALKCFIKGIKKNSTIEEVTKQAITETRSISDNKSNKDASEEDILAYIVKNKIMRNLKTKIQNRTHTLITLKTTNKKKSETAEEERAALIAAGAEDKLSAAYKKKMDDRRKEREEREKNQ